MYNIKKQAIKKEQAIVMLCHSHIGF